MKDDSSPSPSGDSIVIRFNLHLHDVSGKLKAAARARSASPAPRAPSIPEAPRGAGPLGAEPPVLEGALDHDRLRDLVENAVFAAKPDGAAPDVEFTLVLCV